MAFIFAAEAAAEETAADDPSRFGTDRETQQFQTKPSLILNPTQ
jgi:hypothetical protein